MWRQTLTDCLGEVWKIPDDGRISLSFIYQTMFEESDSGEYAVRVPSKPILQLFWEIASGPSIYHFHGATRNVQTNWALQRILVCIPITKRRVICLRDFLIRMIQSMKRLEICFSTKDLLTWKSSTRNSETSYHSLLSTGTRVQAKKPGISCGNERLRLLMYLKIKVSKPFLTSSTQEKLRIRHLGRG